METINVPQIDILKPTKKLYKIKIAKMSYYNKHLKKGISIEKLPLDLLGKNGYQDEFLAVDHNLTLATNRWLDEIKGTL